VISVANTHPAHRNIGHASTTLQTPLAPSGSICSLVYASKQRLPVVAILCETAQVSGNKRTMNDRHVLGIHSFEPETEEPSSAILHLHLLLRRSATAIAVTIFCGITIGGVAVARPRLPIAFQAWQDRQCLLLLKTL
jgi:hypothetical protein